MATKQQLELRADTILAFGETDMVSWFCLLWTEIIKPGLNLLKSFTGPQIDKQIENLEQAADSICNGTNQDVANYCRYWNIFNIKSLLKMVQIFTGSKVDEVINKFIMISHSFWTNNKN